MAKWLTAFVLVATLSVNALAGFSMHPADEGCGMPGCCETARAPEGTPGQVAAQTCCTLNCPQPAPTGQTVSLRTQPLAAVSSQPAGVRPPSPVPDSELRLRLARAHPQDSQPTYIRHLALLI
ncbi:MAG: hypothetical protein M3416_00680 [Acidobacteriota bacterium]|nr:hypothetical protein [Acidobacteriota bacterium]